MSQNYLHLKEDVLQPQKGVKKHVNPKRKHVNLKEEHVNLKLKVAKIFNMYYTGFSSHHSLPFFICSNSSGVKSSSIPNVSLIS